MTRKIGVRELKNRASEIVREVHEQEAELIVTLRGEPVAAIRPLTEKSRRELLRRKWTRTWRRWIALPRKLRGPGVLRRARWS
jgi:prevent-host-death family protein